MIKLLDILKEITEGKQVGILYHYTSPSNIKSIEENGIKFTSPQQKISDMYFISTTRKKQTSWEKYSAEIVLDGDKISEKYKIIPIQAMKFLSDPLENDEWVKKHGIKRDYSDEYWNEELAEERILSKIPGYLSPEYILKVNLPENKK